LVYVHYNLRLWVEQLEQPADVDAISLENIDTLSEWRVESERSIMEEAPLWLEVEEEQPEHVGVGEDLDDPPSSGEELVQQEDIGTEEAASSPAYTHIHT
jgi:hypothetical protein